MADAKTPAAENYGGLQPGESNARAVRHTETKTTTVEVVADSVDKTAAPVVATPVIPATPARAPKAAKAAKKPAAERTR